MTLQDILDGNTKVVLAHKSAQHHAELPHLVSTVQQVTQGALGVGTVVRLPRQARHNAQAYLNRFDSEMLRLVDPELFIHPGQWDQASDGMRRRWAYLRDPLPTSPDDAWLQDRFNEQFDVGANALLTPGFVVSGTNAARSLAEAFAWVRASRQAAGDQPMFVNLTFHSSWLADEQLRDRLLSALVHQRERHWYVRVYWPRLRHEHAQLEEPAILSGYRELAEVAAAEGAVLLLPNTDLVGWLGMSVGASGFSTGLGPTDRRFGEGRFMRRPPGQPAAPARERFFERELLHIADRAVYATLSQHLGAACSCRYCQQQAQGSTWRRSLANLHYLFSALCLPATDPTRQDALQRVQAARSLWQGLPATAGLMGDNRPMHLSAWEWMLS